jgi:antitoxin (DNA-binding transcriptional repressor) of toxin-antitoxin stability system
MRTVGVREAESHIGELLKAVERGETIAIKRGARLIARLVPAANHAETVHREGVARFVLDLIDEGRRDTVAARFIERYLAADDVDEDAATRRRLKAIDSLLQYREKQRGQFEGISVRALIDEGRHI